MTRYLSAQQVLFVHARLLAETGGEPGILNLGLLDSAVARPRATFGGDDLYPTLFLKAAAMLQSLLLNHPFLEGNKRVAITAAGLFLQANGYRLTVNNDAVVAFVYHVLDEHPDVPAIAEWLERHTKAR